MERTKRFSSPENELLAERIIAVIKDNRYATNKEISDKLNTRVQTVYEKVSKMIYGEEIIFIAGRYLMPDEAEHDEKWISATTAIEKSLKEAAPDVINKKVPVEDLIKNLKNEHHVSQFYLKLMVDRIITGDNSRHNGRNGHIRREMIALIHELDQQGLSASQIREKINYKNTGIISIHEALSLSVPGGDNGNDEVDKEEIVYESKKDKEVLHLYNLGFNDIDIINMLSLSKKEILEVYERLNSSGLLGTRPEKLVFLENSQNHNLYK